MNILALDPSLKAIGWALLDSDEDEVIGAGWYTGHESKDIDNCLYEAVMWLRAKCEVFGSLHKAKILAIEVPIYVHNARTFGKQCQLLGALRVHSPFEVIEIYPSERRKVMNMDFKGKSAKEVKQMIMDEVNRRYGLEIESDHVSDAVAIALAAKEKLSGSI